MKLSNWIRNVWPGVLLAFIIALPSWYLGQLIPVAGAPVFAILIGMIVTLFIKDKTRIKDGITYTSKKILQYAVILLGFGLNLSTVLQTGAQSLPVIASTVAASLIIAFALYRVLAIPSKTAVLVGVGSSICGGSAIAATAPVIEADDEEIAQAISVIFLFNVAAALLFPTLGDKVFHMTDEGFALFAGTAVNDTSSVTAAAAAWDGMHGGNTLEGATVVKLTRTLVIIPITLFLALYRAHKAKTGSGSGAGGVKFSIAKIFPMFILYFILASVITTIAGNAGVPSSVFSPLKTLSKFFIVMAMAAIGINTDIATLIKKGGKPLLLGFCCWAGITAVSLAMQHMMGLW